MRKAKKQKHYQRTESIMYKYPFLVLGVENLTDELKAVMINDGVGSVDPGAEAFRSNKFHSVTESAAIDNIESARIKRIKEKLSINKQQLDKINRILEKLSEEEQRVIRSFYIEGKKWHEIAAEMHFSEKWCGEFRNKAIEKISIALGFSIADDIIVEAKGRKKTISNKGS